MLFKNKYVGHKKNPTLSFILIMTLYGKFYLAVTVTTGCKPLHLLEIQRFLLKLRVQLGNLCKSKVVGVGLEDGWFGCLVGLLVVIFF